jgi:hypothetical protein
VACAAYARRPRGASRVLKSCVKCAPAANGVSCAPDVAADSASLVWSARSGARPGGVATVHLYLEFPINPSILAQRRVLATRTLRCRAMRGGLKNYSSTKCGDPQRHQLPTD